MKKIPTVWLALIAGVVLQLVLLTAGGFDLRVGGDGPASILLFITHLPAMILCCVLPLAWQTEVAAKVASAILLSGFYSLPSLPNEGHLDTTIAQPDHRTKCGRAASVSTSDATGGPRR